MQQTRSQGCGHHDQLCYGFFICGHHDQLRYGFFICGAATGEQSRLRTTLPVHTLIYQAATRRTLHQLATRQPRHIPIMAFLRNPGIAREYHLRSLIQYYSANPEYLTSAASQQTQLAAMDQWRLNQWGPSAPIHCQVYPRTRSSKQSVAAEISRRLRRCVCTTKYLSPPYVQHKFR